MLLVLVLLFAQLPKLKHVECQSFGQGHSQTTSLSDHKLTENLLTEVVNHVRSSCISAPAERRLKGHPIFYTLKAWNRTTEVWLTCTVQRVVPGDDSNTGPPLSQAADLVVLDAAVHHCDTQTPTGVKNLGLLKKDTEWTDKKWRSAGSTKTIWRTPWISLLHACVVTFMDTSWTRFLSSGLSKGMLSSGVPSTTSFPNMVPFSLIFLVRRRVSMPVVHGDKVSYLHFKRNVFHLNRFMNS